MNAKMIVLYSQKREEFGRGRNDFVVQKRVKVECRAWIYRSYEATRRDIVVEVEVLDGKEHNSNAWLHRNQDASEDWKYIREAAKTFDLYESSVFGNTKLVPTIQEG